jgi:hypothetical protein
LPYLEPTQEVLSALQLTSKQFQISLELASTPGGLTLEAVHGKFSPSENELIELIARGFILRRNGYFHASIMGAGLLKAIADFVAAS